MVDDSHASGFVGARGRGTPEHCGVMDRVDIITGTLGKALGGAAGGYTSARKRDRRLAAAALAAVPVLQQHRRRSIAAATLRVLDLLEDGDELRARLRDNAAQFRARHDRGRLHARAGRASDHPGDARRRDARRARWPSGCSSEGIYVIGFSFPVVPKGKARIRTQMSAAHTRRTTRPRDRGVHQGRHASWESIAMKALVKARSRARPLAARTSPMPDARPERRADPGRARPRSAAPTCTSTTGTPGRRRPSRCRWWSATSSCGEIVDDRQRGQRLRGRRARLRRRPHHLRPLPQLPRRPAPPVPQHRRRRRQPPGLLRRVPRHSRRSTPSSCPTTIADEIAAILDPLGNATHTALSFDLVGEDVLITGAGPIGIMAAAIARHVGARHVVVTDVNDYRLELARKMGATRARQRRARRRSTT